MAKGVYLCELKGTGKGMFLNVICHRVYLDGNMDVFPLRKMLRQFIRSVNHSQGAHKSSEAESILMKMESL